jgi:RHS repeat-associated protein
MMVGADGTRHGYTGSVSNYNYGGTSSTNFNGYTADGTFTDYDCYYSSNTYGKSLSVTAKLANGTIVSYNSPTTTADQAFPTRITDAQGNYISITYRNNRGPEINTITDTLGRVVTFNYDALNRLISVDVPKMDNGGTRTAIRLHYKQMTLSPGFAAGITTDTATNTPNVIDAIYYPSTNTGYWFGADPNASDYATYYSSYGMISKVIEQRGMNWSGSAGDQGTITQGTMSKQAVYDYPLTANYTLTDAPTYANLTESWAGMDTAAAVTNYQINFNATPRTVTVTQPNGLKSVQLMYNAAGQWNDGLIYQDETYNTSNVLLSQSNVTWQQGAYSSPRPSRTEVKDEKGQILITDNFYSTSYNQLTSVKEYDYDGTTLLRETRNTYENGTNYTYRHIFNLVKTTEVLDAGGNRLARSDYEYDNYQSQPLEGTPGVVQHDYTYDPYTTATQDGENCLVWGPLYECGYPDDPRYCRDCEQYEQVSAYNSGTEARGNVTKMTTYADAASLTGAISETRKYDITGNLINTSSACCELTSFTFDAANQYAYPISQTRGSSDPNSTVKNTASAVYDFNTGLVKQTTDANGRTSTTTYNADTLRPTTAMSSTGAYSQTVYDEAAMKITEEVFESGGASAGKTIKYLNGIGQVVKEESLGANGVFDFVEAKYTNLGQPWKQTRPFRSGDTLQWTETFYDIQGRTIKVQEPDGSLTQAFHNETVARPSSASALAGNTIRVVDAWGRERWGRYDAKGKLAEVVEPNGSGDGTVAAAGNLVTKYKYDVLNRLIETEQGDQLRKFKYDSLGRLTRQKLAEQSATLNDAGQYVGTGNWSESFLYDGRSNLIQKTDARGVRTNYSYQTGGADDPLNRLQSRSYDLSGPLDSSTAIYPAPSVTFEYKTTGDKTRISRIRTAGILTEDYSYDAESRISEYTQTIDYRTSYPMTTGYIYDTLNRIKEVHYPAQYGITGSPRKVVEHSFDAASRLSSLKVGGQQQAGDIIYNAADQTTSIKIGAAGANQITENYTFDQQTGLLTNQKVIRGGSNLLDLSYEYNRNNSVGTLNGKTGHLTKIVDNLNNNKNREYEFDALGRLTKAKGGISGNLWTQNYSYDRYGNRTNVTATGVAADNSPIPVDGTPNLSYDTTNNRITTEGYQYDAAGNLIRGLNKDGDGWLNYEYDAANRLYIVKRESDGAFLEAFQYGSSNARLMSQDYTITGRVTMFAAVGGTTLAEYTEFSYANLTWTKSYNYLGDGLLSTISNAGGGAESTEFNHPDRLGTRTITNQTTGTSYEQTTLPFGTALNAESSVTNNNKRFTSYERSAPTGLDYAVNRTYDSKQGRFTQVDPIGMQASSLLSPQTLNLYTYCGNDPINHTDPDGLFWGFFKKLFKIIALIAVAVVVAVMIVALVSIGAGIVSLVIALAFQNFIQTTLTAIYDEIKKRGFSLGSILRGFGKGIGRFFKGFLIGYYGNYCSPINPNENEQMNRPPIDELDAACQAHDRDYFNARTDGNPNNDNRQRLRADISLFGRALLALFGRGLSPAGRLFAAAVVIIFGVSIIVRTFRGNGSQTNNSSQTVSQTGDNFPKFRTKSSNSSEKNSFQLKKPILAGLTPR